VKNTCRMRLLGTIVIPGRTESANRLESMSLRQRMAYKKRWRQDAANAALVSFPRGYRITSTYSDVGKRKVVITGYRKRLCDRQNFARGCKPVLDGLVDAGVLVDDSEKWLDDVYVQRHTSKQIGDEWEHGYEYTKDSGTERIVIEVWE
jgi:hypothetical protein